MIEVQTLDGRQAFVAYLDDNLEPVDDRDAARLIKIVYQDNGESRWLVPRSSRPRDALS